MKAFCAETLDGLVRLRASPPDLLLLNQNQEEISGLLAARLVSRARGLESLPIFLYDNVKADVLEEARKTGVAGCFQRGTPFSEIVNRVITHLVASAGTRS